MEIVFTFTRSPSIQRRNALRKIVDIIWTINDACSKLLIVVSKRKFAISSIQRFHLIEDGKIKIKINKCSVIVDLPGQSF